MKKLIAFFKDEDGLETVEYAIILGLIVAGTIGIGCYFRRLGRNTIYEMSIQILQLLRPQDKYINIFPRTRHVRGNKL